MKNNKKNDNRKKWKKKENQVKKRMIKPNKREILTERKN